MADSKKIPFHASPVPADDEDEDLKAARRARRDDEEEEEEEDDDESPIASYAAGFAKYIPVAVRLYRVMRTLFTVHVTGARNELRHEQGRLLRLLVFAVMGATLLGAVGLLTQVFGVWTLTRSGLSLGIAVLIVGGIDLVIGILMLALVWRALRKPLFPATRARLQHTIENLRP